MLKAFSHDFYFVSNHSILAINIVRVRVCVCVYVVKIFGKDNKPSKSCLHKSLAE